MPSFGEPLEGKVGDAGDPSTPVVLTRTPMFADQASRDAAMAGVTPSDTTQHVPDGDGGFIGLLDQAAMPDDVVQGMHSWMVDGITDAGRSRDDAADEAHLETAMSEAWGSQREANTKALAEYAKRLPPEELKVLMQARNPATGQRYITDPAFLARLAGVARKPQPAGTGALDIAGIEKMMREQPGAYRKDEAVQARYRQLIGERERAKGQ
jgi:hypothetical protein